MSEPGSISGLEAVLESWRASPELHEFRPPASEDQLAGAERSLGRTLPRQLAAMYRFSNGMEALQGNLMVEPLSEMVDYSNRLRLWRWPIAEEVLAFGGNGAGDIFGLWTPSGTSPANSAPVVMVGQVFERACMALVGTALGMFLRAWSGYYLSLLGATADALAHLGLPPELEGAADELGWTPYLRWADPNLPDHAPDPYRRGLDAEGIAALVRQ